MTTLRTRTRVGADGNVVVRVGVNDAGAEVEVVIAPASVRLSPEAYQALIDSTAGSISDPTFMRQPLWETSHRESLD